MDENELKAAFAAFLLEDPTQPFAAALKLFPSESQRGEACRVTFAWPNDPFVIVEMERLKAITPANKNIPSKEAVIEELWNLVKGADKFPAKDRATAAFMIAKMLKYVDTADDGDSKRMPSAPIYKIVTE